MSKPFSKRQGGDAKVSRNTFDLSFSNSSSMEIGKLYPVFCKEVLPGDTFKIDTAFGLRFMPMAFPIQTKMRANLQFFYVRNRNLWNKWQQFITKTGVSGEFPYVSSNEYCKTGSLGDYLGLPTTLVGVKDSPFVYVRSRIGSNAQNSNAAGNVSRCGTFKYNRGVSNQINFPVQSESNDVVCSGTNASDYNTSQYINFWFDEIPEQFVNFQPNESLVIRFRVGLNTSQESNLEESDFVGCLLQSNPSVGPVAYSQLPLKIVDTAEVSFSSDSTFEYLELRFLFKESYTFGSGTRLGVSILNSNSNQGIGFYFKTISGLRGVGNLSAYLSGSAPDDISLGDTVFPDITYSEFSKSINDVVNDVSRYSNYKVSALPFRAYESIYNAFYRDDRNNPYIVNGVSDPNVYLPTREGGLDSSNYSLHRVNWEQDFLTTAVPTPQQGAAPLVGITSSGKAIFMDSDGQEYNAQFKVGEDGDTVESVEFPDASIPADAKRTAIQLATEGISINDFRNVNSLQRWLETNMRKGYKYKDQIASHFGVNISYAELDMPEFIGGVSQRVQIQQVNQTSAGTSDDPLGSYAGQASVIGANNHTISNYCDEHGFIIGLFYVVPVPVYSQLLPKHFLKFDPMDYFFPEFGHLGYQPIKYDEVCPLQANYSGVPLTDTYGYQRAWYDYLQSVDEVHGDFRTTLQSFMLMRLFRIVPSLNPDFLTVSQDQLNEVFTVTEVDGEPIKPILGQIHFDVLCKRKIPRYGIPRLE